MKFKSNVASTNNASDAYLTNINSLSIQVTTDKMTQKLDYY